MPCGQLFVARLIVAGTVRQAIEFEAPDATRAWVEANDGIDPLSGRWVEMQSDSLLVLIDCQRDLA